MKEKRRILNFVFSNSSWKDGRLIPAYRKPFDLLALTNAEVQKERAVSPKKHGPFEICLPFVNEFRPLCTVPLPEMTAPFRDLVQAGFPCGEG
jgi:hypothetical protein